MINDRTTIRGHWAERDHGDGVLLLLNDYSGDAEEFHEWYTREHLPERILGVDGFRRGRRYAADPRTEAPSQFLTIYEMTDTSVLASPDYLRICDEPTEWTLSMLPGFQCARRTGLRVTERFGRGTAGAVVLAHVPPSADGVLTTVMDWARDYRHIIAGLAMQTDMDATNAKNATSEGQAAGGMDPLTGHIVLLELITPDHLSDVVETIRSILGPTVEASGRHAMLGGYQLMYAVES